MIFCMTVAEPDPDADAALEDCIARIAGGDKDALADLYNRTRPAVYGFALSIVKNAHDAEDILHDACLQVWNAAGGYRRQGKPMAWVLTITRNLALEKLRERGNQAYVIILTAYDSFTYARSALRLGAVDFLLKPFHDGELEQAVTNLRRRMEAGQRLQEPALPGLKKGDKSKYVLQAMDYIGQHYGDQNISVGEIAQHLGLSESHLSHLFRKETDYTLLNYLTRYRIHKAMELLRDCRTKVYEVAERVGYRDITYFSATFKKVTGMSPSEFQDTCR